MTSPARHTPQRRRRDRDAELEVLPPRVRAGGGFTQRRDGREIGQASRGKRLRRFAVEPDDRCAVRPVALAVRQALGIGRQRSLKGGRHNVGSRLDLLAELLGRQHAILFEHTPAEPCQQGERDEGQAGQQPDQTSRRERRSRRMHARRQSTAARCAACHQSVPFV